MTIWTADELLRQIEFGEDSRLALKEATVRGRKVTAPGRKMLADELAALGNASGGTLVFSVADGGQVRKMGRPEMDALEKFVYEICSDTIKPVLPYNAQRLALPEGGGVLLVEVERSPHVHKSPVAT